MSFYNTFAIKRSSFVRNTTSNMSLSPTRRSKSFFNSPISKANLFVFLTTYLTMACATALRQERSISGDVTYGTGNIISPDARIEAVAGSITIGTGNIIEANAEIANRSGQRLVIGNDNIFKGGTVCESLRVGNGNIVGPRAYVGPGVILTSGIIVGPGCSLTEPGTIPAGTVIDVSRIEIRELAKNPVQHLKSVKKGLDLVEKLELYFLNEDP